MTNATAGNRNRYRTRNSINLGWRLFIELDGNQLHVGLFHQSNELILLPLPASPDQYHARVFSINTLTWWARRVNKSRNILINSRALSANTSDDRSPKCSNLISISALEWLAAAAESKLISRRGTTATFSVNYHRKHEQYRKVKAHYRHRYDSSEAALFVTTI